MNLHIDSKSISCYIHTSSEIDLVSLWMTMSPITIEDISRQLGISVSTVSKALNDYPDVSRETKEKVFELARDLDYQPNVAARNLRRKRTDNIGFVLAYPVAAHNEYVAELIIGATQAAEQHAFNVTILTAANNQPDSLRRACRTRLVDGLLLRGGANFDDLAGILQAEKMPYVVVGRRVGLPEVSYIAPDNHNGAIELTRHLISLGHQRIAYIARPELGETDIDRLTGYRQVLVEAGVAFDPHLVVLTKSSDIAGSHAAIQALFDLPDRPTAIFGGHDLLAIEAMQIAAQRGLRVPEDIAIAGFDGITSTQIIRPALTTVRQPIPEVGRQAMEMLVARLQNPQLPVERRILPVNLIVRQSTLGNNEQHPQ